MRKLRVGAVLIACLFTVACAAHIQPPVQGEWSNFHNDSHKVSQDAREEAQKPAGEKER
jgi:hypothetical protein